MKIIRPFTLLLLSAVLTACGGGGGGSNDTQTTSSSTSSNTTNGPATNNQTNAPNTTPEQTVTLSWNAPSTREDGEPLQLSEISGYEIYYFLEGTPSGEGEAVSINDPQTLQYVTPTLASGTYYFSIVTIDSTGVYSDLSSYVTAIVP